MKKILNWTFGGFFRTIGRTLAFLLLGGLLGYIAFKNGIKISDIFGIMRVNASTTYSWTTKQSRVYIDQQGTETTTSWQTIPYTQSVSYPVTQMQYRLSYSGGLTAGNSYTFKISYKPNPDALNTSGIWFSDGTNTLTEVNCSGWMRESNDYYANICKVTLESDISSSGHLYVRIVFNAGYVNSVRSYVGDFEETKGIGSVIQDSSIDIMNNQNENTQNIINNNNENTQDIIDSSYICENQSIVYTLKDKDKLNEGFLTSTGTISSSSTTFHTDYIKIKKDNTYKLSTTLWTLGNTSSYCLYNNKKVKLSCSIYSNATSVNITPTEDGFIRFSAYFDNNNNAKITLKGYICKNANQATQDVINDDNVSDATQDASDFFSSFTTNTHGLTGIITAPLNAIQSLTSSVCEVLVLPLPFVNENLTLPCMRSIYIENFGAFMTLYDTITLGIISYWIMVRIFALVKDFKNPDHDEIEVMDL